MRRSQTLKRSRRSQNSQFAKPTSAPGRLIAYYRVSTQKQGHSGLGLESQQAAVKAHGKAAGGTILAEYTEVESGRKSNRPQLAAALAHAKRSKATLVVAKLDRLSRNVAFLSALMESRVEFVALDCPFADKFTIHVLVAAAQKQADDISKWTKDALAAYKARGGKLGSARPGHWKGREHLRRAGIAKGRLVAAQVVRRLANEAYRDIYPLMRDMRQGGATLWRIAHHLNDIGHTTRRGGPWGAIQVKRVLDRYEFVSQKGICHEVA
jgi:DNA invertase Pin-like site-specific DNA recombinase